MLVIKSQLDHTPRKVKKCSHCKKIKWSTEFNTHVYDKAPNKAILIMCREDDLRLRCKKCQNKNNYKGQNIQNL